MGPIQSSLNQSLGTLATFAGISKVGQKIENIEQNISTPEQRAAEEAKARSMQQKADWNEELKGVKKQLKGIDKASKQFILDWQGIDNKYVTDEKGNIKRDVEGNIMLSKETEDFLNKINVAAEDRVALLNRQKDLELKLNKTNYKESLDKTGKGIANQVMIQKMIEAIRNADSSIQKDLIQKMTVNDLYTKLKGGTR